MDSNEESDRARIELILKEGQGRCIICLEEWADLTKRQDDQSTADEDQPADSQINVLVNRLMPCNHLQCNTCFVHYQVKESKSKCPVCQVPIERTSIINIKTMTESNPIEIQEYFASKRMEVGSE